MRFKNVPAKFHPDPTRFETTEQLGQVEEEQDEISS